MKSFHIVSVYRSALKRNRHHAILY